MELRSLLEASLYYDAAVEDAITELYERVHGVVLLFERERLAGRGGPISDHGSTGPGHVCFRVAADEYEAWKRRVADGGEIVHEHEWSPEHRSFYFRDPAGNLLEIANGDLWPR
jgi:catechol 2,3-dioxygenase-like lactoylglutathione lyase family enzyme